MVHSKMVVVVMVLLIESHFLTASAFPTSVRMLVMMVRTQIVVLLVLLAKIGHPRSPAQWRMVIILATSRSSNDS